MTVTALEKQSTTLRTTVLSCEGLDWSQNPKLYVTRDSIGSGCRRPAGRKIRSSNPGLLCTGSKKNSSVCIHCTPSDECLQEWGVWLIPGWQADLDVWTHCSTFKQSLGHNLGGPVPELTDWFCYAYLATYPISYETAANTQEVGRMVLEPVLDSSTKCCQERASDLMFKVPGQ